VRQGVSQLDVSHRNQNNVQSEKEFLNQLAAPQGGELELSLQVVA
jgi:hypothetical protein